MCTWDMSYSNDKENPGQQYGKDLDIIKTHHDKILNKAYEAKIRAVTKTGSDEDENSDDESYFRLECDSADEEGEYYRFNDFPNKYKKGFNNRNRLSGPYRKDNRGNLYQNFHRKKKGGG